MKTKNTYIDSIKEVLFRMNLNTWTRLTIDGIPSDIVINTSSSSIKLFNCPGPINPDELIGNEFETLTYDQVK